MRRSLTSAVLAFAIWLAWFAPTPGLAAAEHLQLFVTAPYLELHTGPGRGYPVRWVVGRGEAFDVLMRRTDWYKVRTERGEEGWAAGRDMALTRLADGSPFIANMGNRAGFTSHNWEAGVLAGSFGGASLITVNGAGSLTDNLKVELTVGQYLGNVSNGYIATLGLSHIIWPGWRLSPFLSMGTGIDVIEPKVSLVQPVNRRDQLGYVGAGLRFYLTRRFFLRAEYRDNVVFTKSDFNEVDQEWKLGCAFFF